MLTHQPKGGMCLTCTNRQQDCSHLPFSTMPVIDTDKVTGAKIVKCLEYNRAAEKGS